MKMDVKVLADLIIHSFLRGVDYEETMSAHEEVFDLSEIEKAIDEYHLFRPADGSDKDGDWDYTSDDKA